MSTNAMDRLQYNPYLERESAAFLDILIARAAFQKWSWMHPVETAAILKKQLLANNESLSVKINDGPVPTEFGDWTLIGIGDKTSGIIHAILFKGDFHAVDQNTLQNLPVFIHAGDHFAETYHETNRDFSKRRLHKAMQRMKIEGSGLIIYLKQEGLGSSVGFDLARLNKSYVWYKNRIVVRRDSSGKKIPAHVFSYVDLDIVRSILESTGIYQDQIKPLDIGGNISLDDPNGPDQPDQFMYADSTLIPEDAEALIKQSADSLMTTWVEPWKSEEDMRKNLLERSKSLTREIGSAPLPTEFGDWTIVAIGDKTNGLVHHALIFGNLKSNVLSDGKDILVRLHSSCHTSETFHAENCECRQELELTMKKIQQEGRGVILYLQQEGRGNGVVGKLDQLRGMFEWDDKGKIQQRRNPNTQERVDTVQAYIEAGYVSERRDFSVAGEMLENFGIKSVRLITNNPRKIAGIRQSGVTVRPVAIHVPPPNEIVASDLKAKALEDGHDIPPEFWTVHTISEEDLMDPIEGDDAHEVQ